MDIEPNCLRLNDSLNPQRGHVYHGSQDDPVFLNDISNQRGPFDIVIDDGSHRVDHIKVSFENLSKYVRPGGIYVVEDVHACYWNGFRGTGKHVNIVSYFQDFLHSLNAQAVAHKRCSNDITAEERIVPPCSIKK